MAPTGSFDCLAAAIQAGADPVYFGIGQLNMRAIYIYRTFRWNIAVISHIYKQNVIKAYLTLNKFSCKGMSGKYYQGKF